MSWQGGSLFRTYKRVKVHAGNEAFTFPEGATSPVPSKPFAKDGTAWEVRYTGVTNSLYGDKYGWQAHIPFRYAFRSKEHADRFRDYMSDNPEKPL